MNPLQAMKPRWGRQRVIYYCKLVHQAHHMQHSWCCFLFFGAVTGRHLFSVFSWRGLSCKNIEARNNHMKTIWFLISELFPGATCVPASCVLVEWAPPCCCQPWDAADLGGKRLVSCDNVKLKEFLFRKSPSERCALEMYEHLWTQTAKGPCRVGIFQDGDLSEALGLNGGLFTVVHGAMQANAEMLWHCLCTLVA